MILFLNFQSILFCLILNNKLYINYRYTINIVLIFFLVILIFKNIHTIFLSTKNLKL